MYLNISYSPILNLGLLLNIVIPINKVSLYSAAEKNLPEATHTVDNIYNHILDHWTFSFDVSFLLLIDQIEAKKYRVSKEGKVRKKNLSIPDRQIILITQ